MNLSSKRLTKTNLSQNDGLSKITLKTQAEQMLYNATLMTETAMDLKERCCAGEKYVCYLRSLAVRAGRTISAMQNSSRSFLLLAQKLAYSAMKTIDLMPMTDSSFYNVRLEYERLLNILEKELAEIDDLDAVESVVSQDLANVTISHITEKIKYLETKQKISDHFLPPTSSSRSFKSDVDEKYPENWSRDSLIDLNNVVNLPSVPEDIFTSFPTKPVRTSSLSSLKSLRKVKLFLHRAAGSNSSDDDESEYDDQDTNKSETGDSDELKMCKKSGVLGNIKEETLQD